MLHFRVEYGLNDTGITRGGNGVDGNNSDCSSDFSAPQDCDQGRDADALDNSDGVAGFRFTRLDAMGADYTGSGTYSSEPWSCVRDEVTGLIWEVKTDDDGIHDRDNTYTYGNWATLVDDSNNNALCGQTDWRLPTLEELTSIVNYSAIPTIDSKYFPNARGREYWTSSPVAHTNNSAWLLKFLRNSSGQSNQFGNRVRLVRTSQ